MTRKLQHLVVGYSKKTDKLVEEYAVSPEHVEIVKKIANVGADDPEGVYSYVLDDEQAAHIAEIVGFTRKFALEYFLEAEAVDEKRKKRANV